VNRKKNDESTFEEEGRIIKNKLLLHPDKKCYPQLKILKLGQQGITMRTVLHMTW